MKAALWILAAVIGAGVIVDMCESADKSQLTKDEFCSNPEYAGSPYCGAFGDNLDETMKRSDKAFELYTKCMDTHSKRACEEFKTYTARQNQINEVLAEKYKAEAQSQGITNSVNRSQRDLEYRKDLAHYQEYARIYSGYADAARRKGDHRAAQKWQDLADDYFEKANGQ